MDYIVLTVSVIVALVVGIGVTLAVTRKNAKSQANSILEKAKLEAEVLKNNEVIKGKEEGLSIKSNAEKQANQRLSKVQAEEAKLKQHEIQVKQQQADLQRKKSETDRQQAENEKMKASLDNKSELLDDRKKELDRMEMSVRETLERVSGLSADEAKEKLVESLKDEAKTAAASYINDIMDDAKMTANKEAKRIIVETIQRVATETAIENAVTVFHIDNDDIKGRIIGREGRNIRALEAATGVEIIVDDTPEAIVLSGFDPVRREIARLALHQLVADGRIHPARIEEVVAKVRKQVEEEIIETGKRTSIDLGIHGLHPEMIRHLF